jgi:cytoskeletal protein RodZ
MPETGVSSIGAILQAERLRTGRELDAIAADTKIPILILEALEHDDFDAIPAGAYRRSFLRQYARALGLNDESLLAVFHERYEVPLPLPVVPPPAPLDLSRYAPGLLVCVLLTVAGFSLYKVIQRGSMDHPVTAATRPAPHPVAAPEQPRDAPKPGTSLVSEAQPAPVLESAPQSSASRASGSPVQVMMSVTEPVWVSVTCDGNVQFRGLLVDKDSRSFNASVTVSAVIGNAGGIVISLNGQPLGNLGKHGEVKLIEFTPAGARRLPRRPAREPLASPEVPTSPPT